MGMLSLPDEPNKRLIAIVDRAVGGVMVTPMATAGTLLAFGQGMFAMMAFVTYVPLMFLLMLYGHSHFGICDPTPRISGDLRESPRRIAGLLAKASRHGMAPMDRIVAQHELERTVEALTLLCGKDPWIAAAQSNTNVTGLDDHLKVRADRLVEAGYLFELVEPKIGCSISNLRAVMAYFVPLLASVASDFGLDTTGLTPTTARVSGQVLSEPIPISHMSESLHRLATEWREGANDLVDTLVRIDADAAAGRDLRALENAWAVARADAAPELVDAVDERFGKAAASLSATLADAIAARGQAQMRTLEIEARYVETKHAA